MVNVTHRMIEANGIRMHMAEAGSGPLVILCHGFPESWYSWRHQLEALSEAGFHAVAPDMRGYGGTDRPAEIEKYTLLHLVGDMVGLLDALGAEQAVIAGHDWGAPVAWHAALLRPDRFRSVIGLSVPFRPRGPVVPTTVMPQTDDALFYQLYFQAPGVAEAEFERDTDETIRKVLFSASGNAARGDSIPAPGSSVGMVPRNGGFLSRMAYPSSLPSWLTEADIEFYAGEFKRTGFAGALNWYRNIDRN
jgi:pimeloyl-ACP methyl ester carboxylesterase